MEIINKGYAIGNILDILTSEQKLDLEKNIQYVKDATIDKAELKYRFDFAGGPPYTDNTVMWDGIKAREEHIEKHGYHTFQRFWEYDLKDENITKYFDKISVDIGNALYPKYNVNLNDLDSRGRYMLYENGDLIKMHEDGFDARRLCVVLLYLNDDWKDGDGGELVIKNNGEKTIVLPKLGNYAVLDFTKNNVSHEVLKVNNNFKRFSYIHFLNFKDIDTETFKLFKEDKIEFKN
jgi:hypothetical protein